MAKWEADTPVIEGVRRVFVLLKEEINHRLKNISGNIKEIRNTADNVERLAEDATQSIEETNRAIDVATESIDDMRLEVERNTQAQAQLKLVDRLAEITSVQAKLTAQRERVSEELNTLEKTLVNIGQRYGDKHKELDQRAEERIRELGEHIFKIDEQEFEKGVEEPFVSQLAPMWEELRVHNNAALQERKSSIAGELERVENAVDQFVDRREGLRSDVDDHQLQIFESIEEPTTLDIPFYVVTIEREGTKESIVVPPSRLETRENGWNAATLNSLPGLKEQAESVARFQPGSWRTRAVRSAQLYESIAPYTKSGLFGQISYEDPFNHAIGNQVNVKIEKQEGES